MGGCCSSSIVADTDREQLYYYCPQTLEERKPVLFTNVTSSVVSPALLIDTNLESSVSDAYQAPLAPHDVDLTVPQKPPGKLENCDGHMQVTCSGPVAAVIDEGENLKGPDYKNEIISQKDTLKAVENEPFKLCGPNVLSMEEEDVCPTCLEEYNSDNPRIITKCEHHFHLSCILEWMERSETCPICDQIMMFDMGGEE